MKITVRGLVASIMDIFALFIASLLLKCSDIKKWVIWVYIILRVLDLLSNVYAAFNPSDKNSNNKKVIKGDIDWTIAGIFAIFLLIVAFAIFIMDLYVLYKMYNCETVSKPIFWSFVIGSIVGWIIMAIFRNK